MDEIDYISYIKHAFNEIDNQINNMHLNMMLYGKRHCKYLLEYDLNYLEMCTRALRDKLENG